MRRPFLLHQLGECALVAGDALGKRDRRVVAGLHDDALQQFVEPHLGVDRHHHRRRARGRAAVAPGVDAHDELVGARSFRDLIALNTIATVISLLMLAGDISRRRAADRGWRRWSASIRMAWRALVENSPVPCARRRAPTRAQSGPRQRQSARRRPASDHRFSILAARMSQPQAYRTPFRVIGRTIDEPRQPSQRASLRRNQAVIHVADVTSCTRRH